MFKENQRQRETVHGIGFSECGKRVFETQDVQTARAIRQLLVDPFVSPLSRKGQSIVSLGGGGRHGCEDGEDKTCVGRVACFSKQQTRGLLAWEMPIGEGL